MNARMLNAIADDQSLSFGNSDQNSAGFDTSLNTVILPDSSTPSAAIGSNIWKNEFSNTDIDGNNVASNNSEDWLIPDSKVQQLLRYDHLPENSIGDNTLKIQDVIAGNNSTVNAFANDGLINTQRLGDFTTLLRPDLSGDYFNVVQEPLAGGDNFDVQFRVQNEGLGASGAFDVHFYLSTNDFISTVDRNLGSYRVSGIAANSDSGLLTTSLALPDQGEAFWNAVGDGDYTIGMYIDQADAIAETDETNNRNVAEFDDSDGLIINSTKLVDLSGQYFNVVQEPLDAGDTFSVQFRVGNTDINDSGDFNVNFYLSTNDYISTADYELGSYTVDSIAGNDDSGLRTALLTLPGQGDAFWNAIGDGDYTIGMYIDQADAIAETNEGNNRNVAEFDDSDGLAINNTKLVDLSGQYFNVVQEPRSVGDSLDVQFRIENTEVSASGAFDVNFYLSTNDYISIFDYQLGSYTVNSIAGNSNSGLLSTNFTLPGHGDDFWDAIGDGTYTIGMYIDEAAAIAETDDGNNRNVAEFDDSDNLLINETNTFTQFRIIDASGDSTQATVFDDGILELDYDWGSAATLDRVNLQVLQGNTVVYTLGSWTSATQSDRLINLSSAYFLTAGDYDLRLSARTDEGDFFYSDRQAMSILPWARFDGDFTAETFNYTGSLGGGSYTDTLTSGGRPSTGAVYLGRGGTDTLNLVGLATTDVAHINGFSLPFFSGSTSNQAIFRGTAFDYLTLNDGREIYFQGIETLNFADSALDLFVQPNDTWFDNQWNLHVSDVDSAWRFTQGSSNVLLASLDSGILTPVGGEGGVHDISLGRLITDASDDDNLSGGSYGHGHKAISVMASTSNNADGVAGINWNSDVYVNDVYGGGSSGVDLQQAITDTLAYARANNQRVVFQGGIQGEGWLTDGGTQAQLEQLIQDNDDIALFAIAAGNGGPGGNLNDPDYLTSVSGVAKLQTGYDNVMSVGALARTGTDTVNGLTNASSVDIASYSNRGSNLTMMAATNSRATTKFDGVTTFGGTSAANPNMAGIASLVWSVNGSLDGGELRQVLTDTAMDLGTNGRDNTFGHGLVNADAAVRRAWALNRNSNLASLYSGSALFA